MTSTSQNGWPALDRPTSLIATYTVEGTGTRLPLRVGDVATVLLYVAERFHAEVEPLHTGWCWGYAARNIKGSSTVLSNHASATAVDLNAPAHPLGTAPASNFTSKQIAAIHTILDFCDGVVRWGGDYTGRKDGMHFEINKGSAAVKALAVKIRKSKEALVPTKYVHNTLELKSPYHRQVMLVQRTLNEKFKASLTEDGEFGPKTEKAVKAAQKAKKVTADGIVGPKTTRAIGLTWAG